MVLNISNRNSVKGSNNKVLNFAPGRPVQSNTIMVLQDALNYAAVNARSLQSLCLMQVNCIMRFSKMLSHINHVLFSVFV